MASAIVPFRGFHHSVLGSAQNHTGICYAHWAGSASPPAIRNIGGKMRNKALLFVALLATLLVFSAATSAEEEKDDKTDPSAAYEFTVEVEVERTPVKNQYRTGTCWCFATISFLESELLRTGKGELDL